MLIQADFTPEPDFGFPNPHDYKVEEREPGKGKAVYALRDYKRGEMIARLTGTVLPYRTQHTLQINPGVHLLDLEFVGYLAHSCAPNVFVDMQALEVWALEDIPAQGSLTMDYASTEDFLYRQFPCLCGSSNCRGWITGRKERVNEEGLRHLEARG